MKNNYELMRNIKIAKKDPVSGLKSVISRLFDVKLDNFDLDKYAPKLPTSLKELYEIDAFYAKHDCAFETIRFFCNQDRLVPTYASGYEYFSH